MSASVPFSHRRISARQHRLDVDCTYQSVVQRLWYGYIWAVEHLSNNLFWRPLAPKLTALNEHKKRLPWSQWAITHMAVAQYNKLQAQLVGHLLGMSEEEGNELLEILNTALPTSSPKGRPTKSKAKPAPRTGQRKGSASKATTEVREVKDKTVREIQAALKKAHIGYSSSDRKADLVAKLNGMGAGKGTKKGAKKASGTKSSQTRQTRKR